MKVAVYAIKRERTSSWHISLDIRVDLIYWFSRHRDSLRIWMLEPPFSYGQAVGLCEKLNGMEHAGRPIRSPNLLLRFISEQMSDWGLEAESCGKLRFVECDYRQWAAYQVSRTDSLLKIHQEQLSGLISVMQGRSLLLDEVIQLMRHHGLTEAADEPLAYVQAACLTGAFQLNQGVYAAKFRRSLPSFQKRPEYRCHRCGGRGVQLVYTECIFCGTSCPYCEQCLNMGRSRFCSVMVNTVLQPPPTLKFHGEGHEQDTVQAVESSLESYIQPWGLSEIQAEASLEALKFLKGNELQGSRIQDRLEPRRFLIWAVTGAGKTEMIFPLIQYTAANGGRVVVATPRRDVVLELKPRLEKAFAPLPVVTLYGGSEQRWDSGSVTIATTHQLLRFHSAFDLVIIDELDAFPYTPNYTRFNNRIPA